MNLPNKLTVLRVLLIPFFVFFLMTDYAGEASKWIALAIFVAASLTDWFDGFLARKYKLVTAFGKFMDPLADKLLVSAALICMIGLSRIDAVTVLVIISREFIISGFRFVAVEKGVVIAAGYWGKVKTTAQMVTVIFLIVNQESLHLVTTGMVWFTLAVTVISLIDYLVQNRGVLKN